MLAFHSIHAGNARVLDTKADMPVHMGDSELKRYWYVASLENVLGAEVAQKEAMYGSDGPAVALQSMDELEHIRRRAATTKQAAVVGEAAHV